MLVFIYHSLSKIKHRYENAFCAKISLVVQPILTGKLTIIVAFEKKINLCVVSKGDLNELSDYKLSSCTSS